MVSLGGNERTGQRRHFSESNKDLRCLEVALKPSRNDLKSPQAA